MINKNLAANYTEFESINYIDELVVTNIDLKNKILKRENDEFIFLLDLKERKIIYKLLAENLEFAENDINCSIELENSIIINYEFDGKRQLIIQKID